MKLATDFKGNGRGYSNFLHIIRLAVLLLATLFWNGCVTVKSPRLERVTVSIRGHGPDILLIPGLACSGAVWNTTSQHLEKGYRLHIVEINGFGGLPAGGNGQSPILKPIIDEIDTYIRANKLKSPGIIGHSLGGMIAMMLAHEHPEDVGRLMIVDTLPFFGAVVGANDVAAAMPHAASMRDRILNGSQEDYAQGERAFIPSLVKSPEGIKLVTEWALASDKSVVAQAMFEDMTTDLRSKVAEIKTPTTILYAWDTSSRLPQAVADGMYQRSFATMPNKTIVRIDGSYHFIMLDQPDLFVQQVDQFLANSNPHVTN